jgi:hypothetical protein
LHSAQQYTEESNAVSKYFYGMEGGFYVELGGLDGLQFSNTIGLSLDLKWRGALMEGSPSSYSKLVKNRPHEIGINAVVCKEERIVHYIDEQSGFGLGAVYGIWEFMSPGLKKQFYPGMHTPPASARVPCVPLGRIFEFLGITHVNFLSLDIEGNELGALESIDFDKTTFDVMCIEGNMPQVRVFLESKGYAWVERLHWNNWFVRKGFVRSVIPKGKKLRVEKVTASPFT